MCRNDQKRTDKANGEKAGTPGRSFLIVSANASCMFPAMHGVQLFVGLSLLKLEPSSQRV